MKQHTVGIDISKAHLDAYRLADGESGQFDNDLAGIQALIDWIGTRVECVAYEATGASGPGASPVPGPGTGEGAWQARRYAEATGTRAKTDAVDARILAQMAATVEPRRTAAPSKTQRRLQMSRDALMRQRTAVLNAGDSFAIPCSNGSIRPRSTCSSVICAPSTEKCRS